ACKKHDKTVEVLSWIQGISIMPKGGTFIGARMGRPEKAKERKMAGDPNVLFPTGSPKNRSLTKRYKNAKENSGGNKINLEVARFRCRNCSNITIYPKCELCGSEAVIQRICPKCGAVVEHDEHCGVKTVNFERRPVNLVEMFEDAKKKLQFTPEDVRGVKGLSNKERIPERLEKGFLRAKHQVYVFRDGTSRFDASDVPLTHFIPKELGVGIEKLKELGYERDYLGKELVSEEQVVPLKVQDIILAERGAEYFERVAKFMDDLLVNFYGMDAFYNVKTREDLVGHLCLGLSPHTSAGILCRIVGFTKANVGYAHPYFHTGKRRNCFDGETVIPVFENNEWKLMKIRELVEKNLKGKTMKDDFGTEYKETSGFQTLTYNKKTKEFEIKEIKAVSKHRNSRKMIEIKTKSGRKITVTPDHPFPGEMNEKITAEAVETAQIPWKIDICERDVKCLDLLNYSKEISLSLGTCPFKNKNMRKMAEKLKINYKTLTNYKYRKSYPYELIKKMNIDIGPQVLINAKRDNVNIKRIIKVDEDLLFLLGIYLAEGHCRKKDKMHYQIGIAVDSRNHSARKAVIKKIEKVFGIKPSTQDQNIIISSRIIYDLFKKLKIGDNAKTKRVPAFVFGLPKKKIASLLKGYFFGDGSVSLTSTLEVNATSVNKNLLDEIGFLLSRFGIAYSRQEEEREIKSGIIMKFYGKAKKLKSHKIRIYSEDAKKFIKQIGFSFQKEKKAKKLLKKWHRKQGKSRKNKIGNCYTDKIIEKRYLTRKDPHSYSLTVPPYNTIIANGIVSHQCDGDEDSVMLLLDALVNFSRHYLNEKRGGTMDSPIVLTTLLNPKEVDDEVFQMEIVESYPLEFYRAAQEYKSAYSVGIKKVEDILGKEEQYGHLPFTHHSEYIDKGTLKTRYVQLGSVPEKIDIQFQLEDKISSVDIADVAKRLILSHFIPDLYGNLRSYSRQSFRCVNCNTIYRRVPLSGKCRRCGGNLTLTIHKGGIEKYLEISENLTEKYNLPLYLKQRINLVRKEIKSIFEDEKIKQTGLSDFI
ncbi:DNA polymerase II large subunit, partial [Candidatus Micrarchaeota archaeon]|nr:DNA polymerase II large subunit [Candidatus Micrarchaeota archaeon]